MYIILSPSAREQLKKIYQANPEKILVLGFKKTGCSGFEYVFELGNVNNNIYVEEHNNISIGIKKEFLEQFNGTLMDYKNDKFESKFVFINPNVKQMCGCGESVSF